MAGCAYCNNTTICTKCFSGYHLNSVVVPGKILCTKCAKTINGCEICANDTNLTTLKCVDC